jgi:hypothetical protein
VSDQTPAPVGPQERGRGRSWRRSAAVIAVAIVSVVAPSCWPTSTTSISRSRRSWVWWASSCSRSCSSRSHACYGARATGRPGATWAGAVAAAAAFATHSGFDFVWHLPAIVLTVTLLVGAALPAPDTAPAPQPSPSM